MPNECWNILTITGNKKQMMAFIEKEEGNDNETHECNMFDNLLPTPPKLLKTEKWYDWRNKNWGTKWNPWGFESRESFPLKSKSKKGELCYKFFTAWCSPIELLQNISPDFPKLKFDLKCREDMVGLNGWYIIENGHIIHEEESETKHFVKNPGIQIRMNRYQFKKII